MESSSSSEAELSPVETPHPAFRESKKKTLRRKKKKSQRSREAEEEEEEEEVMEMDGAWEAAWPRGRRGGGGVMLEGYVEATDGADQGSEGGDGSVARTKSLTDEDLEELKGCLDLGFGFSYDEIPELCNTLPALELCYSMSQRFLDEQQQQQQQNRSSEAAGDAAEAGGGSASPSTPIANWKISSPGDHPDEVKARLKYWAQAVACTVRLCS